MLVSSGQSEEYFMIERDIDGASLSFGERERIQERDNAVVFIEKRKVSMWEYGLFIIGLEGELDEDFMQGLTELCGEEKCLFLQIETLDYDWTSFPNIRERIQDWVISYYKKFIPPYTAVIDLTKTDEEILAAMKQKGRYNIRLAEKKWVIIEQVDKNPYNARIFHELMNTTTARNKFAGNTQKYYEEFLSRIEDSQLLFAYFEEKVIAAGIFVYEWDSAIYYYWASDNEYRKVMAPYLLQWKAIGHAMKRGCKIYDFLWVAGPDEVNSALAGVTDFKRKLTPDIRKVSDSYMYIHKKWKYRLIGLLKNLKK